ncbi:MAG TPA: alanyl-tRNA editing protein [Thermomicrobiales bacterium]|nr:alanyl-tRNA editing protein [Thermomicrobiales bacterium]
MDENRALPETELLYQRNSALRAVEATVVGVDAESRLVALDKTVVFPGGGGQPSDEGILTRQTDDSQWPVLSARKVGAIIWHQLGGDRSLPDLADRVRVELDWERRYRLMRMHTALHVLCGVVFRDYGALVTGGNMGPDRARMDFEMDSADFTPERVAEIERRANEELSAGRDVYVQILPRDEAFQIADLIRTKINLLPDGIAEVRTVEIAGLDLQADGGTHVQNTREVGGLRVVGTRSKGKANKRLEIELIEPAEFSATRDGEDQQS